MWIVWLKDMPVALMIGTVCDHEEVKELHCCQSSPHFTRNNPFYRFHSHFCASLTKTRDRVMQRRELSKLVSQTCTAWCAEYTPTYCELLGGKTNWIALGLNNIQWSMSDLNDTFALISVSVEKKTNIQTICIFFCKLSDISSLQILLKWSGKFNLKFSV